MAILVCLFLLQLVTGFDVKPAHSLLPSPGKSGLIEERTTLQGTWTAPHAISGYGGPPAVNGPNWDTQIGISWGSFSLDECGTKCDQSTNCLVAMWRVNWACVLFQKTCGQSSYGQDGCALWDNSAQYYERPATYAPPPPPPSVNYDQWIHFENQYNGVTTKSYLDLHTQQSSCTGAGSQVQTRMNGAATTGASHWKILGGSGCVKYGDSVRIVNGQTGHYLDTCGHVNCGVAGYGVHTFQNADRDTGSTIWSIWGGTQGACVALGAQVNIKNHYAGVNTWLDSCGWFGSGGAFGVQVVPTTDRSGGALTAYWKIVQASSDPPSAWQAPHAINGYAQQAVVAGVWGNKITYISGGIDRAGCEQQCKVTYGSTCQSATWRGNFGCTLFAYKCDQSTYPPNGSPCAVWGEAAWYLARS